MISVIGFWEIYTIHISQDWGQVRISRILGKLTLLLKFGFQSVHTSMLDQHFSQRS